MLLVHQFEDYILGLAVDRSSGVQSHFCATNLYHDVYNFLQSHSILSGICATVYRDARYEGPSRIVRVGEHTDFIGHFWNDQVSSVRVTQGCTFVG